MIKKLLKYKWFVVILIAIVLVIIASIFFSDLLSWLLGIGAGISGIAIKKLMDKKKENDLKMENLNNDLEKSYEKIDTTNYNDTVLGNDPIIKRSKNRKNKS